MSFFRAIGPQLALPAAFFTGAVLFVRNEHHKAVADANQQILRSINDMSKSLRMQPPRSVAGAQATIVLQHRAVYWDDNLHTVNDLRPAEAPLLAANLLSARHPTLVFTPPPHRWEDKDQWQQALRRSRVVGDIVLVVSEHDWLDGLRFAARNRGAIAGVVLVNPLLPASPAVEAALARQQQRRASDNVSNDSKPTKALAWKQFKESLLGPLPAASGSDTGIDQPGAAMTMLGYPYILSRLAYRAGLRQQLPVWCNWAECSSFRGRLLATFGWFNWTFAARWAAVNIGYEGEVLKAYSLMVEDALLKKHIASQGHGPTTAPQWAAAASAIDGSMIPQLRQEAIAFTKRMNPLRLHEMMLLLSSSSATVRLAYATALNLAAVLGGQFRFNNLTTLYGRFAPITMFKDFGLLGLVQVYALTHRFMEEVEGHAPPEKRLKAMATAARFAEGFIAASMAADTPRCGAVEAYTKAMESYAQTAFQEGIGTLAPVASTTISLAYRSSSLKDPPHPGPVRLSEEAVSETKKELELAVAQLGPEVQPFVQVLTSQEASRGNNTKSEDDDVYAAYTTPGLPVMRDHHEGLLTEARRLLQELSGIPVVALLGKPTLRSPDMLPEGMQTRVSCYFDWLAQQWQTVLPPLRVFRHSTDPEVEPLSVINQHLRDDPGFRGAMYEQYMAQLAKAAAFGGEAFDVSPVAIAAAVCRILYQRHADPGPASDASQNQERLNTLKRMI